MFDIFYQNFLDFIFNYYVRQFAEFVEAKGSIELKIDDEADEFEKEREELDFGDEEVV